MPLLDSRRLTGPGLLLDRPGAVVDVAMDDTHRAQTIAAWRRNAARMLEAVGWGNETLSTRAFTGGASLALSAPPDALYAATELNEWAWASAEAEMGGARPSTLEPDAARLREAIQAESNPPLLALRSMARRRGVTFLTGEDQVSVGTGAGVTVWPENELPAPQAVDWSRVHDVPLALVTGSNGKTTIVRLLAAMLARAGRTPGSTSTDGVKVGDRWLAEGDYSGPSGARMVLRDPGVEAAVLETARGGILRRGLPVEQADVAVITNIADDHLGEFGVQSLADLAATKLVTARAVRPDGRVVMNADDPTLVGARPQLSAPVIWFSLHPERAEIRDHLATGGQAALLEGDALVLATGAKRVPVARVDEVTITLGGIATHNVANALAAIAAAQRLHLPTDVIRATLQNFGRSVADNPGRANLIELGGVRLLIDFAHNPHGMGALAATASTLGSGRRLVMLGQAGDRSDSAIRELAQEAMRLHPDYAIVKELEQYLRGRSPGEVPALLMDELQRLGLPPEAVSFPGSEVAAVHHALEWARPGDLLVLPIHQDRAQVMRLIERLQGSGWKAGEDLSKQ
ncbi:MAG TPA: Mur ligase family protein [Gemmatimonadales bacterium]